ncbi:Esterase TesA [Andreprevotia sp. IGB-42]|uniref:arylesterase n=1 Tax=Andreprevotia sp. IGB-42 TaxID=2497473 RepID=UPI00135848D8|nr:arylesterase [Andreprevotia sp. IGB-42]KAF0812893.1 Esterase TesA [Andreprevotia sp. IGB-42]
MKRFLFWLVGVAGLVLAQCAWSAEKPVLLVFGDSLSAGYGLPAAQAWPVHLGKILDGQGKNIQVINASVSGETTAGGLTRFPQALKQHKPGWVVIELGPNDGLRGLPLDKAKANLVAMVKQARAAGAKVHLIGMQLPPNFGPDYTKRFAGMYGEIAKEQKTGLTPFLLAPAINHADWFQADQLHPTAQAQPAIAAMVAKDLAPLL